MPTLDWLNRDAASRTAVVPTRELRPHAAGGRFGAAGTAPGNLLVQGDNLQALKALLPFYRGQMKCIFIDPPYNTKSAFEHYDDNQELTDGRIFVAEYKGKHLRNVPKEIEKAQVGQLWAGRSVARAALAMLFKLDRGISVSRQIDQSLGPH